LSPAELKSKEKGEIKAMPGASLAVATPPFYFCTKLLFWSLIIQRVQNADINRTTQWIINKKRAFDENRYSSVMQAY
jgi:hypothetical protein